MDKIERHDATLDYTMTNKVDAGADHPAVAAVEKHLRLWRKTTAIESLDIQRQPPPVMNDDVLDFNWQHQDGRDADGTMDFTDDPEQPTFGLTVSAGWTVDESMTDALRDALIDAHNQLGMIELHVTWN